MREIRQEGSYHYVFSPYIEPLATVEPGDTVAIYTEDRGAKEHDRIAQACETGDGAAAAAALAAHLARTAVGLLAALAPGDRPALLLSALEVVPGTENELAEVLETVAT